MKLHALEMQGIGRHHEPIRLPVEELGAAQVVAITGLNGSGKTTLIEGMLGLLYGSVPSHGALAAMANAKDSHVTGAIETDQVYHLSRRINAVRKTPKTEAYIFTSDRTPLNDGKQTTFDAKIAELFPSQRVYLASGFAAQKRNGQFLEVVKAERKALFAEMLGLGQLQAMAEAVGKRAAGIDGELAGLRARVADLQERAGRAAMLVAELAEAAGRRAALAREREGIEAQLAEARKAVDTWRDELASLRRAASSARENAEKAKAISEKLADNATSLDGRLAKVAVERGRLETRLAEREALEWVSGEVDPEARLGDLGAQIRALRQSERDHRTALDAWHPRYKGARDAVMRAERDWERVLERAETARDQAAQRVANLEVSAAGLSDMPCGGEDVGNVEYSACPLITAATRARDLLDGARGEAESLALAATAAKGGREAIDAADDVLRAIGPEPEAPDTNRLPELEAEAETCRKTQVKIAEACASLDALAEVELRASELDREADDLRAEIVTAAGPIMAARRALSDARCGDAAARAASDAHQPKRPPGPDESRVADLRDIETKAVAEVARLGEAVRSAEEAGEALRDVEAGISSQVVDLDDWRHLQKAFGRDGIQALEVDAAGPEVSDLVNELLHSCYGSRFSATLETTALKADGKGTKEVFDLRVVDSEMGTDGSADDLSPGELVLVGEALSLAIAVYNTRRSSIPILDLWRDECAGALDYEKAPLYVTMLRRALELGSFHRVYFIAHQRELWDLADAQIRIADGACHLEG